METEKYLARILLFLLIFDTIVHAASQFCSEFVSPMTLSADGTRVGTIQIPSSGKRYRSNQLCEWTIETDESGYSIQLDVTSCSLQGKDIYGSCNSDYVDVFDSINDATILIGRFCGVDRGKSYRTASNKMIVRFQSDEVLEFSGFQASYQAVQVDSDEESEPENVVLGLAIGIPVGVLAVVVLIVLIIALIRHHRRKKAAAGVNSQTATSASNNNFVGSQRTYTDTSVAGSTDLDRYSRNTPLEVILLRNFPEDSRNIPWYSHEGPSFTRSITPPPPYDSLDFVEVGWNRTSLSPPSYEMVVKYSVDSSSV